MGTLSWINGSSPASPSEAIARLRGHLAADGTERLYAGDRGTVASLSIRTGLTVWCMGGLFRWRDDLGIQQTHPAADPEGAAQRIAALAGLRRAAHAAA
ncbi:hypothetical protein HNR23_003410 [Nocardiopsis mwathae]|uniref:Uncharacterized protein n=1 Tax=Nocardiopsis mwathae TaxID=1472723 RepID=A0A7W9YJL5_9ACTN|nr:hypothetical protein [Nocardiopsis mwathae]MBB6173350.1 hypothetical protein [Nocardiopsis mwathae]